MYALKFIWMLLHQKCWKLEMSPQGMARNHGKDNGVVGCRSWVGRAQSGGGPEQTHQNYLD